MALRIRVDRAKLIAAITARRDGLVKKQGKPLTEAQFRTAMKKYQKQLVEFAAANIKFYKETKARIKQPEVFERLMKGELGINVPQPSLNYPSRPKRCGHTRNGDYSGRCGDCQSTEHNIAHLNSVLQKLEMSSEKTISLSEDDDYFRYI